MMKGAGAIGGEIPPLPMCVVTTDTVGGRRMVEIYGTVVARGSSYLGEPVEDAVEDAIEKIGIKAAGIGFTNAVLGLQVVEYERVGGRVFVTVMGTAAHTDRILT